MSDTLNLGSATVQAQCSAVAPALFFVEGSSPAACPRGAKTHTQRRSESAVCTMQLYNRSVGQLGSRAQLTDQQVLGDMKTVRGAALRGPLNMHRQANSTAERVRMHINQL